MRQKALGRTHSEEVRQAMSDNRKGENGSFFGKSHTEETKAKLREIALNRTKLPRPGNEVEVLDLKTNQTTIYNSLRDAVKGLDTHLSTLLRREKKVMQNHLEVDTLLQLNDLNVIIFSVALVTFPAKPLL